MKNNSIEIKSVLSDIHKSLNSLLENEISLDETNDLYRENKSKFDSIKKESTPIKVSLVKEILYSHNINNFCRLTFIYKKIQADYELEESAGDDKIIDGLIDLVKLSDSEISESEINNDEKLSGTVYAISTDFKGFSLIFGTVSSSKLFNKNKFLLITDIIKRIYEKKISSLNPFFIEYYNIRSSNATEYIQKKLLNGIELIAHVYIFVKIYEIYSHSGRKNLEALSNYILETIQKNYPDASIHIISGGIFLVLIDKNDQSDTKMPRIEFTYNNFPIIYNKIKLPILKDTEVYKFWEELYSFKIYSMRGDQ